MGILYGLLLGALVLVAILLIVLILVQPGKSGGMGAAFGGGSSSSVFGGRGATTFLTKATGILAALFMVLSVLIALTGSEDSVTKGVPDKVPAGVTEQKASEQAAPPAEAGSGAPASEEAGSE